MVRLIYYDESTRTGVLSSSSEAYVRTVATEVLKEDPNTDCNQLSRILAGELEETHKVTNQNSTDVLIDVKSIVYATRSKLRMLIK